MRKRDISSLQTERYLLDRKKKKASLLIQEDLRVIG